MKKTVTNLALDICKLRTILEDANFDSVYKNLELFRKVNFNVRRQMANYIKYSSHELDFTYEDVEILSNLTYVFIENYQNKFLFSKYKKEALQHTPIDDKFFKSFCDDLGHKMLVDTELRTFYKDMGFIAFVIWLWSNTDDKKTIDVMLLDTLRSFL